MAFLRERPAAVDAFVAALLTAFVLGELVWAEDMGGPTVVLVLGSLGITVPLVWRRRAPLLANGVSFASLAVLGRAEGEPESVFVPLLLAAFSVGAHAPRREARIGLGIIAGSVLLNEAGDALILVPVFAGAWFAGRLVRAREEDAQRLRELAEALERERVEQARLAVVEERTRIARELHDVVAHAMAMIVLEAGAERVNLPEGQETTHRALRSIESTGRQALAEMRRLVGLMRDDARGPALAPRPSLANLAAFVEGVRDAGLPVEVEVVGEPFELPPGVDMSAYRIVQEALTNVMKHAGPARASVRVEYGERYVELEVVDDGRGGSPNGNGHGLTGMRERVGMFGGTLEAGAREDGGFAVRARLPVETRP